VKLLSLNLIAFGPFKDLTLDLAAGNQGLHVIYGPNEAGKSSALRAIRQLFYGVDERTVDCFLHSYTSLRVGATIRHSNGVELEFIRRKARINSLRGSDDAAILEARALEQFLGGVDAKSFETLFGISHGELVIGGEAILKHEGRVGEAIFEASMGIVGLRNVRNGLQADCEGLFKPGGKKQKINEAIQEYNGKQAEIKKLRLSADDWAKHDRDLHAAQDGREKLDKEWQQKSRELNRLTRIRNALPAIAQRKVLLAELETHRDVILLHDDFGENLRTALSGRSVAEEQISEAGRTLEQLDREIEQLLVPDALLHQAERIEDLHRKLGKFEKGMEDRPRLVLQKKYLEHDAKEILKRLGQPPDLGRVDALRLRADEPVWIQDLGNQYQGLLADCRNAHQQGNELKQRIEDSRSELARLPDLANPAELRRQIRLAQQQGDLDNHLAAAQEALRLAELQVAVDLARLPQWKGTLEALEVLPVPTAETIDQFEARRVEANSGLNKLDDRIAEEEARIAEKNAEIRELELQQEVPSEQDLERTRQVRDAGWRLVRDAWQKSQLNENAVADFVAKFAPAQNLAESYERSVAVSDQVADRLRREADRVARKVELVSQRERSSMQIEKLATLQEEQGDLLDKVSQEWADLWKPLGLTPGLPKEMRAWARQQSDLIRQAKEIREQRERVRGLRDRRADLIGRIGTCLCALGEPSANQSESLAVLLDRGQGVVDSYEQVTSQRLQLQKLIRDREQELGDAEGAVDVAEKELSQWQLHWGKATARLGLPKDALPAAANTFLASITELFQKLHEVNGFESRIEGIDRDTEDFSAKVRALASQVATDLESAPPDQAVRELNARLAQTRDYQTKRQTLKKQRDEEQKKVRRANDSLMAADRRLESMCQEAHCSSLEELPQASQRSARYKELKRGIQQREEQILTHSAGASVEEFIAQAETLDPDALAPEMQKLEAEIASLREQIRALDTTIGSEQNELARMNGNGVAAEAAESAENLLAQLQADVQEYAAFRLAGVILQRGIERFREKNQGNILERASRIFGQLTVGSFAGLRIDYDEHGETILVGIRPASQQIVNVEGMSEGSRDQLYLALRLAALEDWLEKHEPVPFIVDDILLNFDNERAVATLKALADLSQRTQVIFFTHHQHLVEMAQKHIERGLLFTHCLSG
jgi:uncharacterized protein YhaN